MNIYRIMISMVSQKPQVSNGLQYQEALAKLANEAISEISNLSAPVIQICGPISTGGFGSVIENLENLHSVIQATMAKNISIFNQITYENRMDQILKDHTEYDYPLLDFFYTPLLQSGKISGLVFLPLWDTSIGSKWEYEMGQSLRIPTLFLKDMLVDEIESFYKSLLSK